MKNIKRISKLLIVFSLIMCIGVIVPCSYVSEATYIDSVEIAGAKLNKKKITLTVGKTYKLKVTGTKKKVKWSSSNKKIATVNSKGKVTAKKKGTATITAKVDGKKLKCTVKVCKAKSTSKTVYITETGEKYHYSGCKYLRRSKIKISLKEAKARGYTACSVCRP